MTNPNDPNADFSDVEGGSSSTAPTPQRTEQQYTVVHGDTLSGIARKFYGHASHWKKIFEANRDLIHNPDLIHEGQVFTIPADE